MTDSRRYLAPVLVAFVLPVLACFGLVLMTPGIERSLFTTSLTMFGVLAFVAGALIEIGRLAEMAPQAAADH